MLRKKLDPFDTVRYNSDKKPNSRTLLTSLGEKLSDTFEVINGGTSLITTELKKNGTIVREFQPFSLEKTRPGLFDYLTLGIFRGIHAGFSKLRDFFVRDIREEKLGKKAAIYFGQTVLALPYAAITLAHGIGNGFIRPAVSTALTLAFAPLVAFIVQPISLFVRYIKAQQLAKEMDVEKAEKKIMDPDSPDEKWTTTPAKLKAVLGKRPVYEITIGENKKEKQVIFYPNKERKPPLAFAQLPATSPMRVKLMEVNESAREALDRVGATRPRHR